MCLLFDYLKNNNFKNIAITGQAGVGKSTLALALSEYLKYPIYSTDYQFIGDSKDRQFLLDKKRDTSLDEYIDCCNQYNWWNWNTILNDLQSYILLKKDIQFKKYYNRQTGKIDTNSIILKYNNGIIYEGAILGNESIIKFFDVIIFISIDDDLRFKRLIKKDKNRRTISDICSRFLITNYSEHKHYSYLFRYFDDKLLFIDEKYDIVECNFTIQKNQYIPIRMAVD